MSIPCRSPQEILDDEILFVLEKCEHWLSRLGQPRNLEPASVGSLREYCVLWKARAEAAITSGDQSQFRSTGGSGVSRVFIFEWNLYRLVLALPHCYL